MPSDSDTDNLVLHNCNILFLQFVFYDMQFLAKKVNFKVYCIREMLSKINIRI